MKVSRRAAELLLAVATLLAGLTGPTALSRARAASLRPLLTEEAAPLPSGDFEALLGASYSRNLRFPAFTPPGYIRSQDLLRAPELGFRVGAGGWVEIQADFDFLYLHENTSDGNIRNEYGNGDLRLFTKVKLLSEATRRPGLGLRFGTQLPNASKSKGLGTDETDFAAAALASKDFGPVATHVNLGLAILGNPGPVPGDEDRDSSGQDDLFVYSVALVSRSLAVSAMPPLSVRLGIEASGSAGSRFHNDRHTVQGGIQLTHGPITLYFGPGFGLVTASENYGLAGGLIYRFRH